VLFLISLLCESDKGWEFKPTFEVEKLETEKGKPRKYGLGKALPTLKVIDGPSK
jgi:hypothetical protein